MKLIKRRAIRHYVQARRFVFLNLLHADDPPHRLALGVAIGMFWTFTPFIGIQMVAVLATAWLLRANKIVGVPLVWISNPATFVPIFYPCYVIGRTVLGWPAVGQHWWQELTTPPEGFFAGCQFYWSRVMEVFAPLMLGCVIISIPLSTLSYVLVRTFVQRYRIRAKEHPHALRHRLRRSIAKARKGGQSA